MEDKTNLLELDPHSREMLINAVTDQCGGHIFAIIVSLDKLDEFAQLPANQNAKRIISYLLSPIKGISRSRLHQNLAAKYR
eukprot:scaffold37795_cov55-Attheya_sp.AAC.2